MKRFLFVFLLTASTFGASYHFTAAGDGSKNGADWSNTFPDDSFKVVLERIVPGDKVFLKGAQTYTPLTEANTTSVNASDSLPIGIFGVLTSTTDTGNNIDASDFAVDTVDMPDINIASRMFILGSHSKLYCCKFRGTDSYIFSLASNGYQTVYNCVFRSSNATATNRVAIINQISNFVRNIFISTGGCGGIYNGVTARFTRNRFIGNRVTGTIGVNIEASSVVVANVITGFFIGANVPSGNYYPSIMNNTIYACSTGIAFAGTAQNQYRGTLVMNNVLDSCYTDGIKMGLQRDVITFLGNHGSDARCTDMWDGVAETGVWMDPSITTGDPKFANPPDSLQLDTDSPARNTGIGPR